MVTPLAPQQLAGILPRQAVRMVQDALQAAGCPDADYDARELLRIAAGKDPRLLFDPLTRPQAECLAELAAQRMQRVPLQYLAGEWDFLGLTFKVGPGVLCPRADTEVVAEAAANTLTGIAAPRVLDLCAGTGCLGLGVKRFCPAAQVTCVEKSPEAFVYLEKNCRCALKGQGGQTEDLLEPTAFEEADAPAFDWGPALNALRAKAKPAYAVQPVEGDLFTYWQGLPEGQLDLIVSNPPYLTDAEVAAAEPEVRDFDPVNALVSPDNGLADLRKILRGAKNFLNENGTLACECGVGQPEVLAKEALENLGFSRAESICDLSGRQRFLVCRP